MRSTHILPQRIILASYLVLVFSAVPWFLLLYPWHGGEIDLNYRALLLSLSQLSNWVNAIRNRRRTLLRDGIEHEDDKVGVRKRVLTKALTSERIRLLDSIEFVWSIAGPKAAWEDRFRELMEYYDANDRWPSQSMGKLGEWIHKQRMQYSKRDEKFMKERAPKVRERK